MELSKFDSLVANILEDVQTKVGNQITDLVKDELKARLDTYNYDLAVHKLNQVLEPDDAEVLQKRISAAVNTVVANIQTQLETEISNLVYKKLNGIDVSQQFNQVLATAVKDKIFNVDFPEGSVSAKSIKQSDLAISGDQVAGGIIKNFASTGIDDQSTGCVVTILDAAVVVENNLVTMDLTVEGDLNVKGKVDEDSAFYKQLADSVTKAVQQGLDTELFAGFSDTIFSKIKTDGLDLSKITVNENVVIEGDRIGYTITESNLQKLGLLKELQVSGETQLADTLYVGNKRTGINTLEPSAALAIWDEDIEITVSKERNGQGRIGTPRNQSLVLGSNQHSNIVLNTDGSTQVNDLRMGNTKITSSDTPPGFASTKGHIVFNANPSVGGPLGWVCLGAANWANFGIVD
jgi:hypothetical protein